MNLTIPKRLCLALLSLDTVNYFKLVTCLGVLIMFVGGVPGFQTVVAIVINFATYKSDLVSPRATLESSFSMEQRSFTISTIIPSTIINNCQDGVQAVKAQHACHMLFLLKMNLLRHHSFPRRRNMFQSGSKLCKFTSKGTTKKKLSGQKGVAC